MKSPIVPYFTLCSILCLALLLTTCSDDDHGKPCSVDDPVQDLPWLKTALETYQTNQIDISVEQAKYRFRTVFTITPCCLTCKFNMIPSPVYTCSGEVIDDLSFTDEEVKDRKVIWKTPDDEAECW